MWSTVLWVFTSIHLWYISHHNHNIEQFHDPWNSLILSLFRQLLSSPHTPGNHWQFLCPYSLDLYKMLCEWTHTTCTLQALANHLVKGSRDLFMVCESMLCSFKLLITILLSEYNIIYLFTCWKTSKCFPFFGDYK